MSYGLNMLISIITDILSPWIHWHFLLTYNIFSHFVDEKKWDYEMLSNWLNVRSFFLCYLLLCISFLLLIQQVDFSSYVPGIVNIGVGKNRSDSWFYGVIKQVSDGIRIFIQVYHAPEMNSSIPSVSLLKIIFLFLVLQLRL